MNHPSFLISVVEDLPSRVPNVAKPILRPFLPVYQEVKTKIYRSLGEREEQSPWGPKLIVDYSNPVERGVVVGTFEPDVIEYIEELIATERFFHFADIGANIGFYSILFSINVRSGSKVDAFEPLERNLSRLRNNIKLNQSCNINVHPFGLSDSEGDFKLSFSIDDPGQASLSNHLQADDACCSVLAKFKTFDKVYQIDDSPDILKIDVEGAEINVIRGAMDVLSTQNPDIILELHPSRLEGYGTEIEELTELLEEAGYTKSYHIEDMEWLNISDINELTSESSLHLHIHC